MIGTDAYKFQIGQRSGTFILQEQLSDKQFVTAFPLFF